MKAFAYVFTIQAALPDLEMRSDALKKEKEEADSAWKLAAAVVPSSPAPPKSDIAAEGAATDFLMENLEGSSDGSAVSVDSSSDSASASDAAVASDAVVTEPQKPQQLLDLEEACKDADDSKRSHQR